jgi:hypothetical protein
VTPVGPAFARLGPGASTAATRSSGAGGFPRDLVRDGWQAAGSSSRRCSAGCPPVPDAAAGGYADGGIRAGRRRRQEDGRDGQGSRRPEAGSSMCITPPAMHRERRGDEPSGASAAPARRPPAAGHAPTPPAAPRSQGRTNPLFQHPLDAPGVVAYREHRCSFAPARARCCRAPLPATGTQAKPARLPSMTPISPGTLTVSVADTRPASDARPAWRCSRCARPVGMFGELVAELSCPLKASHGLGRRTRTRARPAAPGTISGDCALESRATSCMAPAHLSQARGTSRSSSRISFTGPRRPVNDTVPPRPHPVSAFNVISR